MGKQFLIKDSIASRVWTLGREKKFTGEYECYNASYKDSYTTHTVEDGAVTEITKERVVTAWYTPQISISNGPSQYEGLPGLILEINDGELTLVCNKIVMNPKETVTIEEPQKGKVVCEAKFQEIMEKKNNELMEQMKGRNSKGENRIMIIGG